MLPKLSWMSNRLTVVLKDSLMFLKLKLNSSMLPLLNNDNVIFEPWFHGKVLLLF